MALPVTELYALFLERRPEEKARVEQARLREAKVRRTEQMELSADPSRPHGAMCSIAVYFNRSDRTLDGPVGLDRPQTPGRVPPATGSSPHLSTSLGFAVGALSPDLRRITDT